METYFTEMESPVGTLLLVGTPGALHRVEFARGPAALGARAGWTRAGEPFGEAIRQLRAYFGGELTRFDLPLAPQGTEFQRRVWMALREIPYGETRTYAEQARRIGKPAAVRAVGAANGRNPLAIVVPCHRVIGSDGSLTGFGGGLETKRALLELESRVAGAPLRKFQIPASRFQADSQSVLPFREADREDS